MTALRRPLSVSQHGQLSLLSLRGRLISSNPCCSGLRRQTAEGVGRGVVYRPRQRVLLPARLECRLAAGSRPRNGDERRSLALWAVREPTSHWGLCLVFCCSYKHWNVFECTTENFQAWSWSRKAVKSAGKWDVVVLELYTARSVRVT